MAPHLRKFDASEVAKERLRIIKFYIAHGEKSTKEAFCVGRKTICVWRKRLNEKGPVGLIPFKTAPIKRRSIIVSAKSLDFIASLRKNHYRLGKAKIKPLLDEYCRKENLPIYSTSKIGRIIKRNTLFYQVKRSGYNDGRHFYKKRIKRKRDRVKYAPKHKDLGHIQMDTIMRIEDGIRYYLYTAIDISGKFALTLPFKTLTSKNTVDFFEKLTSIIPYEVVSVQTDNGLEFLGMFEEHLSKKLIKHLFTYPRCPKINGCVERFNRTIQEEFVDPNLDLIHNQKEFQKKLSEYLIFYNTKRVHQSLNYETPLDYLIQKGGMSEKYRTRTNC